MTTANQNRPLKSGTMIPVLALVGLAALACRFALPSSAGTSQATEPALGVEGTGTAVLPTVTPTPRMCPIQSGPAALPQPGAPSDIATEIIDFLDHGGDPVELQNHLAQAGRSLPGEQGLAQVDLSGDGLPEVALVLLMDGQLPSTPPGMLMVFTCRADGFTIGYSTAAPQDRGAPLIQFAGDLTGDGVPDLLLKRELCGAHTCTAEVEVIAWRSGSLKDVFDGSTVELPSPHIEVGPPEADGSRPLSVTATGINSVGAGPFRQVTYTWSWDEDQMAYVLVSEVQAPPTFRIHMLHEADETARAGDLRGALDLYRRVEEDESLDSWMDPQRERQILGAYARFRRIVLHTRLDQVETAIDLFQGAVIAYASNPETTPFVEMGEAYWDAFGVSQSAAEACRAARSFASAHAEQVLETLYFGYANPSYAPDDVCLEAE